MCATKICYLGATIVRLRRSVKYFKQLISVKTGGEQYLAEPSVVYNLNLAHFLTSFSTIELTARNTAYGCYVPATKALVLVAGPKGFQIESFQKFNSTIKLGKGIDISITTKNVDQILVVDSKDHLRFARVDEPIKLHSRATPFAHVFANLVNQLIEKEEHILNQVYELKNFSRTNPHNRKRRNILEFFLGRSAGAYFTIVFFHHSKNTICQVD